MLVNQDNFDISFYIEDKYYFYLEPNNINNIYLCSNNDKYELIPNNLMKKDGILNKDNICYQQYNLNVNFDYEFEDIFKIPKCFIQIDYDILESISIDIGSFSSIKINEDEQIYVSGYKGIINDVVSLNDTYFPTIVGSILSLKNCSNKDAIIKSIMPLNGQLEIQQENIMLIDDVNIDNDTDINVLLNNRYNLVYQHCSDFMDNYSISNNNVINILIPISYTNIMITNVCGFVIEYEVDNITYYEVITDMLLFNSTKLMVNYNIYVL